MFQRARGGAEIGSDVAIAGDAPPLADGEGGRGMTKVKFQFVLGMVLLMASNPVFAKMDGNELFQQFSSEIRQYEMAHHLPDLMVTIRKTIPSATLRSSEHHEYAITRSPDLFYDVTGLEKGQHPSHTTGDWDCDSEKDQAVIVQEPRTRRPACSPRGSWRTPRRC